MSNKELDTMWKKLETEEGYKWYEDEVETCGMCSHKVSIEEYDPSLGHCLECHGG